MPHLFSSVSISTMAIQGIFYKTVARRFSTLLLACAAGAYVFDLTINGATNAYWDTVNKGKQWKDIKDKIAQ
uniref:Complex III subunit 9 n=1 Tax=Panagrolaimus sp. PS1159 TaxID=55785 RepID=A0AC35F385_9BILA